MSATALNVEAPIASGLEYDVFLGYSRADAPFAVRLQQELEKVTPPAATKKHKRLRVFLDTKEVRAVQAPD